MPGSSPRGAGDAKHRVTHLKIFSELDKCAIIKRNKNNSKRASLTQKVNQTED